MEIKKRHLMNAKPENLIRLAKSLRLQINGMSHKQIAKLVYWRIRRDNLNRY